VIKNKHFPKLSLTKELSVILAVKTTLLFVLWWLFFNPQTKTFVDENKMANVLVNEPAANKKR
jgi:hypothetical protein